MDGFGDFSQIKPKDPDSTPLSFGKHRGLTPWELYQNDPDYLVWAWENVGPHVCSRELYELARELAGEHDESDWNDDRIGFGRDGL
jgi:hypothetical protein